MADRLKGHEVLSDFETRAKELVKGFFAKYNPDKGDLFDYQDDLQLGYEGRNFNMLIESEDPNEKLVVIISRDWQGITARHTMVAVGQYDESRFLPKVTTRAKQIELDVLKQTWIADSQEVIRCDWDKTGANVGPDEISIDRANELLTMAENMLQNGKGVLHINQSTNGDAYRQ